MKITETKLEGCFIIEPKVWEDPRGYFFEAYKRDVFNNAIDQKIEFIQDNESSSKYGVVRGLHMQKGENSQSKLVRVLHGKILDVAVDVRKNSPTFGQYITVELSAKNRKQLFIPHGFLHGFSVLSQQANVLYKCDANYDPSSEDSCFPLDEKLNIDWQIPKDDITLSEKDQNAKSFLEFQPY